MGRQFEDQIKSCNSKESKICLPWICRRALTAENVEKWKFISSYTHITANKIMGYTNLNADFYSVNKLVRTFSPVYLPVNLQWFNSWQAKPSTIDIANISTQLQHSTNYMMRCSLWSSGNNTDCTVLDKMSCIRLLWNQSPQFLDHLPLLNSLFRRTIRAYKNSF